MLVLALGASCATPTASAPAEAFRVPTWAEPSIATIEVDLVERSATVLHHGVGLGLGAPPVSLHAGVVAVGQVGVDAPPGMRRVAFAVHIATPDGGFALAPTSILPMPAGQRGVLLIAERAEAVPLPARVSTSNGNSLVVELASDGPVAPNGEFNGDGSSGGGSPFAFFSNRRCRREITADGCLRYETFPASGAVSQTVGFDAAASVRRFRARLLIAADGVPR
ncbi:MAG: hypothetical protein SFW08_04490 [Gemmatimonadaceae bacterium]|nr:hypothetical protein [Gemmatimonadaceae bacterium]